MTATRSGYTKETNTRHDSTVPILAEVHGHTWCTSATRTTSNAYHHAAHNTTLTTTHGNTQTADGERTPYLSCQCCHWAPRESNTTSVGVANAPTSVSSSPLVTTESLRRWEPNGGWAGSLVFGDGNVGGFTAQSASEAMKGLMAMGCQPTAAVDATSCPVQQTTTK